MNSEIYKYLLEQGFNDEEINYIDDNNEMIWKTNLLNCEKIFEFLKEKGYSIENIHNLLIENPIIISLDINELDKIIKTN